MKSITIENCRLCTSTKLINVLDLGEQPQAGFFPNDALDILDVGPLTLCCCQSCGLTQLRHDFADVELYGTHYGYRSGLNMSMVQHLQKRAEYAQSIAQLKSGDTVIDIGANDGTSLGFFGSKFNKVGFDPSAKKFENFFPKGVHIFSEYFSKEAVARALGSKQVKLVTSYSMFYDLPDPLQFANDVFSVLENDGVWITEQSYLPSMCDALSFDTICHEHLEYYTVRDMVNIAQRVGFSIAETTLNEVNGGSFVTTFVKDGLCSIDTRTKKILDTEVKLHSNPITYFAEFKYKIEQWRNEMNEFFQQAKKTEKRIGVFGASTKGNVLLNYLNLDSTHIVAIGEVNPDKFGKFAPGSNIPIISERELIEMDLDYYMVLPWHFHKFFISNKKFDRLNLVFPLPKLAIREAMN